MLGAESQNMFDFYDNPTAGGDCEDSDSSVGDGDDEQFVLPPQSVQLAGEESTEAVKEREISTGHDLEMEMRVTSRNCKTGDDSCGSETGDMTRGRRRRGADATFQTANNDGESTTQGHKPEPKPKPKPRPVGIGVTLSREHVVMMTDAPALDPRSLVPSRMIGTAPLLHESERKSVQHTVSPRQSSERGAYVTTDPLRLRPRHYPAVHDDVLIGGLKLPAGAVIKKKKKRKS